MAKEKKELSVDAKKELRLQKQDESYGKMKRSVGKPPKFDNVEQLIVLISKYFKETDFMDLTVTGIAIACGTSRKVMDDYQKKAEFEPVITQAKSIVENSYEMSLRRFGRSGDIFALKNFGWQDIVIADNRHSGEIKTGINWIGNANIIQDKAINVLEEPEPKALPEGEEDDSNKESQDG
jgi:hypothetical protein